MSSNKQGGNPPSLNSPTVKAALFFVLGAAVMLVMSIVIWVVVLNKDEPSDKTPDQPSSTARSVAGTDWKYTVDPGLESKLHIRVEASTTPDTVLSISGNGCNSMGATVTTTNPQQASANSSSIKSNGTTYYLSSIISTKMACMDEEKSSYDSQLEAEIKSVFASLHQ